MCIVKGTIPYRKQDHFDCDLREWVWVEGVVTVYYTLKYNQLGQFACDIAPNMKVDEQFIRSTDDYVDIVEPWLAGGLPCRDFVAIEKAHPDKIKFPCSNSITIPAPANDRTKTINIAPGDMIIMPDGNTHTANTTTTYTYTVTASS